MVVDYSQISATSYAAFFADGVLGDTPVPSCSAIDGRRCQSACARGALSLAASSATPGESRFNALQTCSIVSSGFFPPQPLRMAGYERQHQQTQHFRAKVSSISPTLLRSSAGKLGR